ncbi:hypothetical protein Tco_0772491 [Tanacetum coccineum]|uniref:Uncharacterized protein n=1 Tax=Tanacetum coccineum TaxID=301880 RepID=A0ABQ4ZIY2_9ASTR
MEVDSFGLWPPKLGFLNIGDLKKPISKLGPPNFVAYTSSLMWVVGESEVSGRESSSVRGSFIGTPTIHLLQHLPYSGMGFESSVNFNNQIYMPSSVPLSIISEKAYTFVSVNMNLPSNFFDVTVILIVVSLDIMYLLCHDN